MKAKKTNIKSWDEVDNLLSELASIDSDIKEQTNAMNRRCQKIKLFYGERINACEFDQKNIIENLGLFFIDHEDDPEIKGKTFEGTYGKCGLRLTPPSVKPFGKMTWEKVLMRIVGLGYIKKLLRPSVFSIKDIDRELLASDKVNDDLRKEIGVKLHQEERFWYEVK